MSDSLQTQQNYIGRFAPSPTGPLHFGSLVSALASYLDARHNNGRWLVRMEDLDPPREQPGAAPAILQCLDDYGLHWDGEVLYQSQRLSVYEDYLERLTERDLIYPCDCSRQDLQTMSGIYDGRCRFKHIDTSHPHALRLKLYDLPAGLQLNKKKLMPENLHFCDLIQGDQYQNLRLTAGDQIVKRKDGLFAYQLAVVADDIEQCITHIIRGSDLLEVTARQIFLYQLLDANVPQFGHVTLALQPNGQKLSKQNLAPALNSADAGANIWRALVFLGQNPPAELFGATSRELLDWGKHHWQRNLVTGLSSTIIGSGASSSGLF